MLASPPHFSRDCLVLACVTTECSHAHDLSKCRVASPQFDAIDRDQSGSIDINELKDALRIAAAPGRKPFSEEQVVSQGGDQMLVASARTKRTGAPQFLPEAFTMAKPPGRGAPGAGRPPADRDLAGSVLYRYGAGRKL